MTAIYFSDYFAISPELVEEYGAFDVSLINDLPLHKLRIAFGGFSPIVCFSLT